MAASTEQPLPTIAADRAVRVLTPSETAWGLLLPATIVTIAVVLVAAGPLASLISVGGGYTYWPSLAEDVFFKPHEIARFALAIAGALAFPVLVLLAARHPIRLARPRIARGVVTVQLLGAALMAFVWAEQLDVRVLGTSRIYFTIPTLVCAALFMLAAAPVLMQTRIAGRLARLVPRREWRRACTIVAIAATALWLLPGIYSDGNIASGPPEVFHHLELAFDESISVLDGRSPLVNMTVYGALVPYLVALPLVAFGASVAAFTTLMTTLGGLALLGVYGVLRRVTRHALAALALYVPFLATSLFWIRGTAVARFDDGNYFMLFPIRYGGPYLLAWLLARQLEGERPRRREVLFTVAGLVLLNNADFGLAAVAATFVAVLCARPPANVRAFLRVCRAAAIGLASAFALVSVLTLLRAGTLPHLELLFTFARLIGIGGYGNLPTPLLGFHLVMLATFVAALTTAAVRVAEHSRATTLTAMLAWSGVFGLGTSGYYAYRSHPDTLIALFPSWSFALALLVVVVVRSVMTRQPRRLTLPDLAVLFVFGVAACSVAQVPLPWKQVARIERRTDVNDIFTLPPVRAFVRAHTHPGEAIAIPISLGHRVAYESGVRNVVGYTGMWQMPAREQVDEMISTLRAEGGTKVFLGQLWWRGVEGALEQAGFRQRARAPESAFTLWADTRPRSHGR